MCKRRLLVPVVILLAAAVSTEALAQDRLAPILTKSKISNRDRAQIKKEVEQRAKKLVDARTDRDRLDAVRDKLLRTAGIKGATRAGLDAYAAACADELAGVTTSETLETGFYAVWVLVELKNAQTGEALATALRSRHAATRYRAARGLQSAHRKLAKNRKVCRRILRALGEAGAGEGQALVLRTIYEAIDFNADVRNPRLAGDCAQALNAVFEGRLIRLASGERNETIDLRGYQAAAGCYPAAGTDQQTRLIAHMARFLEHAVSRYFDPDTAAAYLPTLSQLIRQAEDVIHGMIRASKKTVPSRRVADALRRRGGSRQGKKRGAEAAIAELKAVLKGDPWNLP